MTLVDAVQALKDNFAEFEADDIFMEDYRPFTIDPTATALFLMQERDWYPVVYGPYPQEILARILKTTDPIGAAKQVKGWIFGVLIRDSNLNPDAPERKLFIERLSNRAEQI